MSEVCLGAFYILVLGLIKRVVFNSRHIMAQAQLEFSEETKQYLRDVGFNSVHWSPVLNHIECKIDQKHTLILKKTEKNCYVLLKKGKSQLKISVELFKTLCDLKETVILLQSFLEGQ